MFLVVYDFFGGVFGCFWLFLVFLGGIIFIVFECFLLIFFVFLGVFGAFGCCGEVGSRQERSCQVWSNQYRLSQDIPCQVELGKVRTECHKPSKSVKAIQLESLCVSKVLRCFKEILIMFQKKFLGCFKEIS